MTRKHPMQKVVVAENGTIRFSENKIVRFLLEQYPAGLNDLFVRFYDHPEDYEQLTMLIGYSVSGFGDLDTSKKSTVRSADKKAARLNQNTLSPHLEPQSPNPVKDEAKTNV